LQYRQLPVLKNPGTAILAFFFIVTIHTSACAWGFWAHRKINNKAVATLPKEMKGFYSYYINYITNHAIDPDKKRYCDKDEGPHHFIDLDHYCTWPCDSMPKSWQDATAKYSVDTLNKYGTVPWFINLEYYNLVQAFKEKNADKILKISSNIGHYIADSYVPLHATSNYDGQQTGQWGIHSFWESSIPELMGNQFNYETAKAIYVSDISGFAWKGVLSSAAAVDSVLDSERILMAQFPSEKMYCIDFNKADKPILKFSEEFTKAYSAKLDGMVERRMRNSIYAVGCFWMSAWVSAGQPDLNALIGTASPDDNHDGE
jgi:hypothetical protein